MAEGFAAAGCVTSLRLPEVHGKRLWLVRVPRHLDTDRLEGARVKLPSRKGREGKVLGRIPARDESDDEKRKEGTDNLVLRDADSAERSGFRALFSTKKEDSLAAAAPFAGQVNVSIEPPALEQLREGGETPSASLVEPYRGRPQLKGMRVRVKLLGAGSEYTSGRALAERQRKPTPPATPQVKVEVVGGDDLAIGSAATPTGSKKKKKKRKSVGAGGGGQEDRGGAPASTTKKSRTKSRLNA